MAIDSVTLNQLVQLLRDSGNNTLANQVQVAGQGGAEPVQLAQLLNIALSGLAAGSAQRAPLMAVRDQLLQSGATIRPLDALRSMFTPGGQGMGGLNASELETYFNPNDPAYMSGNIMRSRGITPGQGNEMADFMQQNAANLYRQSDIFNTFTGGTPAARPGQGPGGEALARNLYGDTGMMGKLNQGATNYFTPTGGRDFMQGLNNMVNGINQGTQTGDLGQNLLAQRFTDDPNYGWQTMFDASSGSLSPLLRGSGLQQRVNQRAQDQWRNEGSGTGRSYLDFLTGMYAR